MIMKTKRYASRIEVRLDQGLEKALIKYCKTHDETQSTVIRDAIEYWLKYGKFQSMLFNTLVSSKDFNKAFKEFLAKCPDRIVDFFEQFLGPKEAALIKGCGTFYPFYNDLVITEQGSRALEARSQEK